MKKKGTKEGLIWIFAGCLICFLSWRIHLGSFREPGAGFVAFAAGIALVIVGVLMSLSVSFGNRAPESKQPSSAPQEAGAAFLRLPKLPVLYTVAALLGYGLVVNALGYLITTFLVMFALFYDRGTNRLIPSALSSLLTVVMTYLIFETWLRCQLPRGILPWW
jgi:hypothetical protein